MDYKIKEIIQFDDIDYMKGDIVTIEVSDEYLGLPNIRGTKLRKINTGKITDIDSYSLEVDCSTEFNYCIVEIQHKWIVSIKKGKPIRGKRRETPVLEDSDFINNGIDNVDNERFFETYKPRFVVTESRACDNCSTNILNGGSGICNCTLGSPKME